MPWSPHDVGETRRATRLSWTGTLWLKNIPKTGPGPRERLERSLRLQFEALLPTGSSIRPVLSLDVGQFDDFFSPSSGAAG